MMVPDGKLHLSGIAGLSDKKNPLKSTGLELVLYN